jgi:Arc/MetJ-type ribon-helix-helix transcriptional regulator
MKRMQVELPEKLGEQVESLVRDGWFSSEEELVRTAIRDFLRTRRLELAEQFQREDIAWALQQRQAGQ